MISRKIEPHDKIPTFGEWSPPVVVQKAINLCHDERAPLVSRVLAPLVRKFVVKMVRLPVDILAGGFRLRCAFTDNYSEKKFVFTPWRYDLQERQLIRNELPEDGVFIDIGANIGLYTLTASKVLGPKGRIIAFEPNPETMKRLAFHLDENRKHGSVFCSVSLQTLGIADKDAEFELQLESGNLGASSMRGKSRSTHRESSSAERISIHCRPLLDVLSENRIARIHFLKIDIEGAEDLALTPFLEMADSSLFPENIIIENSESSWRCDLFGLLESKGYRLRMRTKMNSVYVRLPGIDRATRVVDSSG